MVTYADTLVPEGYLYEDEDNLTESAVSDPEIATATPETIGVEA